MWLAYIPAPWNPIETDRDLPESTASHALIELTSLDTSRAIRGPGCPGVAPKWEGHDFSSWKSVRKPLGAARRSAASCASLISGDLRWCRNQRLQSAEKCRHLLPAAEIFGTPNLSKSGMDLGLTT